MGGLDRYSWLTQRTAGAGCADRMAHYFTGPCTGWEFCREDHTRIELDRTLMNRKCFQQSVLAHTHCWTDVWRTPPVTASERHSEKGECRRCRGVSNRARDAVDGSRVCQESGLVARWFRYFWTLKRRGNVWSVPVPMDWTCQHM